MAAQLNVEVAAAPRPDYNGAAGFDFFDVEKYWGGPRMVPQTCKRIYVSTTLCYDIDSVIQAINDEYREKVLRGEIKP